MHLLHIILLITNSLQQQIHFNGNFFRNKCCRCNEASLYWVWFRKITSPVTLNIRKAQLLKFEQIYLTDGRMPDTKPQGEQILSF